jgi:hypothetical protein
LGNRGPATGDWGLGLGLGLGTGARAGLMGDIE